MNKFRNAIVLLMLILSALSCYVSQEGCLDPLSSNYNVATDDECTDCCTYPSVSFQFKHLMGDTILVFGDTLQNNLNQSFLLLDQKFFLCDLFLFDDTGLSLPLLDSLTYVVEGVESTRLKDVILVNKNISTASFNNYRFDNPVHSLKVTFGLIPFYNLIDQSTLQTGNPLISNLDLMYDKVSLTYYSAYFKIIAGENLNDTLSIFLRNTAPFDVQMEVANVPTPGSPLQLPLTFDYSILFHDVNFKSGDSLSIASKILDNSTGFIR